MRTSPWLRLQGIALSASSAEGLVLSALPLLAVGLTDDPRGVSLVTVAGQLPWVAFPLVAGVMIDRLRKSSLLGGALLVQAVAGLALGVVAALGRGSLPAYAVVAFVLVLGQVITEGARGALVPRVADDLNAANARLLIIDLGVVRFLVPPLAGVLVAWNGTVVGWGAAAACVVAAVLAFRLDPGETGGRREAGGPRKRPLAEIKDGLRYLVGSRLLRSITIAVSVASFAWFFGFATFALYATDRLHLGSTGYGLLLAAMAVGFGIGALAARPLLGRVGHANAMRGAVTVEIVSKLSLWLLATSPVAVGVVLAVHSIATFTWNVSSQSSRQRYTPPELLGRVLTSHRALSWGVAPLGAALGGFAASRVGLAGVWWIAAAVQAAGVAAVWRRLSARSFREADEGKMPHFRNARTQFPKSCRKTTPRTPVRLGVRVSAAQIRKLGVESHGRGRGTHQGTRFRTRSGMGR